MFNNKEQIVIKSSVDPKTGETVEKMAVPEKAIEKINAGIQEHSNANANFIGAARQFFRLMNHCISIDKSIEDAEKKVNAAISEARDKIGISKAEQIKWAYNIPEKCLEKRTPPVVEPPVYKDSSLNEEVKKAEAEIAEIKENASKEA